MYLITEGNGHLVFEGQKVTLEPGYLYLIPSFIPCTYFFEDKLAHFYMHFRLEMPSGINIYNLYSIKNKILATSMDKTLFQRCTDLNPGYELPHHDPKVYQTKPWVNKEMEYSSIGHYLETTGIINQLFSRFTGHELTNDIRRLSNNTFQYILTYIQENLTNDLSVDFLAEKACMSRDHFTRIFKSITGMPPREFVIRKRIDTAKLFLLTTNEPLNEIIIKTGFKTPAYFCRIFKKYTSFTPAEFRKKRG